MYSRIAMLLLSSSLAISLSACSHGKLKQPEDWNKKERGAVIGGTSGGVLGGIVGSQSGNTGAGAVIGTAAGAGAGALIGNELDKNEED